MVSLQHNKSNGSFWVYIPRNFVKMQGWKPGKKLDADFSKSGRIVLSPRR